MANVKQLEYGSNSGKWWYFVFGIRDCDDYQKGIMPSLDDAKQKVIEILAGNKDIVTSGLSENDERHYQRIVTMSDINEHWRRLLGVPQ